jgi:tetratricopeptide (TPR) repeat protein
MTARFSAFRGATLIFAVTVLAYLPAMRGGIVWDDDAHLTRPDLRSLHGLERIWCEVGATQQYYPVLHSAFWIEHRLWGDATLGYHLLNVLLHASAACLFVLILRRLGVGRGGPPAPAGRPGQSGALASWAGALDVPLFAGLIFALHPVEVESVAWISEQKNTLSGVCYLLSALVYLRWREGRLGSETEVGTGGPPVRDLAESIAGTDGPAARPCLRSGGLYALAFGLFLLALLSKSVTATLPAALLVIAWWRRGTLSWRRDVAPLAPWLALGLASGLFTAWVERRYVGAAGSAYELGGLQRCLLAGRVIWFYLGKLLWPADLIFIYPHWTVNAAAAWSYAFPLAALAGLAALWLYRRRARGPLAAALFFVGSLFPALGFVNAYPFRYSYVADHFQYLASLGIVALAAAGWGFWRSRRLARIAAAALLATLGVLTWRQGFAYRDLATLYRTTIARNPDCWMAYSNLGTALLESGRKDEAIADLRRALELRPDLPDVQFDLANALLAEGDPRAAVPHYEEALRLQPDFPAAQDNLGTALLQLGRPDEAVVHYREALRLRPDYPRALLNLGAVLTAGHPAEAASCFERALRFEPALPEAHFGLADALRAQGRRDEAIGQYEQALRLRPAYADAHNNLGLALVDAGRLAEAIPHYREALRLAPNNPVIENNLGVALAQSGLLADALAHFERSLALNPAYRQARYNLSLALRDLGRTREADEAYRRATE